MFVHISLLYMSVTKQIALIRFYGLFNISGLSLFILLKSWNPNRVSMTLCTFFAMNSFQILWWNMTSGWNIYFGKFHPETKFCYGMVERRNFWCSYPILKDDALEVNNNNNNGMNKNNDNIINHLLRNYSGWALCWMLYMP